MEEVLLEALATLLLGIAWYGGGILVERIFVKKDDEAPDAVTQDDLEHLKAATAEAFGVMERKIKRLQKRVRVLEAAKGEE